MTVTVRNNPTPCHSWTRGGGGAAGAKAPHSTLDRGGNRNKSPISAKASGENGQYLDEQRRKEVEQFLLSRGFKKQNFAPAAQQHFYPHDVFISASSQGRRHGFLSVGSNRQQGGQPTPKYPKNRKKHRTLATSFSNLGGTLTRFSKVRESGPLPPDPPSATPLLRP